MFNRQFPYRDLGQHFRSTPASADLACRRKRRVKSIRSAVLETLEKRTFLSASVSDSGGFEGSNKVLTLDNTNGAKLTYTYQHYTIPDNFIIRYEGRNLLQTGFVGGGRSGTIDIPKGTSNQVQIIVATNDEGTAWDYSVSVKESECPDTGPFILSLASGEFDHSKDADGNDICFGTGTLFIGRKDGISQMLRIENASVQFDKTDMTVSGTVYSLIGTGDILSKPLFTGSFKMAFASGQATNFAETPGGNEQFQLGGLDVDFSSLTIFRDSVSLGASFQFIESTLGIPDYNFSGPDGLIIKQNSVDLGSSIRFSLPNFKDFNLFGFLPIDEFSNFSIDYDAPTNALKVHGKLGLKYGAKTPTEISMVADLSGENFLQIKDGKLDLKGSLAVSRSMELVKGWGLEELKLTVDTITKTVGGSAKIQFPFGSSIPGNVAGAEFGVEYVLPIPPLMPNKVSGSVDNLNWLVPIPEAPVLFFQALRGSLEHLSKNDANPVQFAGGLGATLGPQFKFHWKIPELGIDTGEITTAVFRLDGDVEIDTNHFKGTGKVSLMAEQIATGLGNFTFDWKDKFVKLDTTLKVLDSLIVTQLAVKTDSKLNFNTGGAAALNIPSTVPMFGGANLGNGRFQLTYSNNDNPADDFIAGWGDLRIQKLGFDKTFTLGVKIGFDGSFEKIGVKNVPSAEDLGIKGYGDGVLINQSGDDPSMSEIAPGSVVTTGVSDILLGAEWENAQGGAVPLQVRISDGTWVQEADFAAHNIFVVDDLTTPNRRVVVIFDAPAGDYTLDVVDPTGLGAVSYTAMTPTTPPTLTLTDPAAPVPGGLVTIGYDATKFTPDAQVSLFYDDDGADFDGILIGGNLIHDNGNGTYVWDTQGVPTGQYHIYGMIADGVNPPVMAYAPSVVNVTEAADLGLQVAELNPNVQPGESTTLNLTVTNTGPSDAHGARVLVTVPDGLTFKNASVPFTVDGQQITLSIGDLANGQTTQIQLELTTPLAYGAWTTHARVVADTYDPTFLGNTAALTTVIDQPAPTMVDLDVQVGDIVLGAIGGRDTSYTLVVRNNGTTAAKNVVLNEYVPWGLTNVYQAAASQGTASVRTGTNTTQPGVVANLGTILPGEQATVHVVLAPFAAGDLTTTTQISSDGINLQLQNNYLTKILQVDSALPATIDLELGGSARNLANGEVAIDLKLSNKGPGVASGIRVNVTVPPGVEFVSSSPEQGTYDAATGVWDVGNIRDNLSRTLTLRVRPTAGVANIIAEVVAVAESDVDSIPNNANPLEDDYVVVATDGSTTGGGLVFGHGRRARFTDASGQVIIIGMSGPGTGNVVLSSDGTLVGLNVTGTTAASTIVIQTPGRNGAATLGNVTIDGSIGTLLAGRVNLGGNLNISGSAGAVTLNSVNGPSVVSIGSPARATALRFNGSVTDLSIQTAGRLSSLMVNGSWVDATGDADTISATGIGQLRVNGNMGAGLNLTGDRQTLGSVFVLGELSDSNWSISGPVQSIRAGSVTNTWNATIAGRLGMLNIVGGWSGGLVAGAIGQVIVGGPVVGGNIASTAGTASVTLRGDAVGFTLYSATFINQLTARGNIVSSNIVAGNSNNTVVNVAVATPQRATTLGAVWIGGGLVQSTLSAGGNIRSISTAAMESSNVFAGANAFPGAASDQWASFGANGSIATFRVRGVPGLASAFAGSNISAAAIGQAFLRDVQWNNNGVPFGITTEPGRLGRLVLDAPGQRTQLWAAPNEPEELHFGDFVVRRMSAPPV